MQPTPTKNQTAVNRLFSKFSAIYGTSWRNQFKTTEFLEFAKNEWYQAIINYDENLLDKAISLCREQQKFPPSIPEFISYCKDLHRKSYFYKREDIKKADPSVANFNLEQIKRILNIKSK